MNRNEQNSVIENDEGNTFEFSCTENSIYDGHSRCMVSWWGSDSYFNNKLIQISDF